MTTEKLTAICVVSITSLGYQMALAVPVWRDEERKDEGEWEDMEIVMR